MFSAVLLGVAGGCVGLALLNRPQTPKLASLGLSKQVKCLQLAMTYHPVASGLHKSTQDVPSQHATEYDGTARSFAAKATLLRPGLHDTPVAQDILNTLVDVSIFRELQLNKFSGIAIVTPDWTPVARVTLGKDVTDANNPHPVSAAGPSPDSADNTDVKYSIAVNCAMVEAFLRHERPFVSPWAAAALVAGGLAMCMK